MNGEQSPTLFDVAYDALKDAYTHSRHNTEVNRIIEEALNRIHNMPAQSTRRTSMQLLEIIDRIKALAAEPAASGYDFVTAMREIERLAKQAQEIAA